MTIKLLSFTYIINFTIINSMSTEEVFCLSLCSTRIRRIIRCVRWTPDRIRYFVREGELDVKIEFKRRNQEMNVKLNSVKRFVDKNTSWHRLGDGIDVELRIEPITNGTTSFIFQFLKSQEEIVPAAIHNSLLNTFGVIPKIEFQIEMDQYLGCLPKITGVTDTVLNGSRISGCALQRFLSNFPHQNSISILTTSLMGRLEESSKLFSIKNIHWKSSESYAPLVLKYFNGMNLILSGKITKNDLVGFLRRWMYTDRYLNLKTVSIRYENILFEHDEVLREFHISPYDPLRRPENYDYNPCIIDYPVNENHPFKCLNFLDIERISDGKLASVQINESNFWFCVWD
ncbi:hypothetical protein CAEBREN_13655 [Caenorhabditis brenneri]|uniref:F-box associated domain-containing protein n=1 Tax=Caenorhabditis brenneri TaxID=135651 RepID=G0P9A9_CAEBE|nr:hypothetical protein CAEBREN_13655 [Caenorhabditis brenneri]